MKKAKRILGKVLIAVLACLAIGTVVNAKGAVSTDVQIEIEATELAGVENEQMRLDATNTPEETIETVQTGDKNVKAVYFLAMGIAVAIGIVCVWKKKRKGMLMMFALLFSLLFINEPVHAAVTTENVSVTIPTSISILFDETGKNSISKFEVHNQSLVPITIEKIHATECNDWSLIEPGKKISVNTKEMVFEIAGKCLKAGENMVSIPVAESTSELVNINITRGAWTNASAKETALQLEFEYAIGNKAFQLSYDTNGCNETIASQKVCNGDTVELPNIEREGYVLVGWEDMDGKLHTSQYIMPIGDVTLKARWKEEIAYAIYSASDTSLRFVRSAEAIKPGDSYNGRIVTEVFTGFEQNVYKSVNEVPWYDGKYYDNRIITKVVFEDVISPKSTAYWFYWASDCNSMDVRKLDMSHVTNMTYMCAWTGADVKSFSIQGINDWNVSNVTKMDYAFRAMAYDAASVVMDLSKWDVSKVTSMDSMFMTTGYYATTFRLGDLSKWNVASATDVEAMFMQAGYTASWSLNLSGWNVSKVLYHDAFSLAVESKITEPKWKS